MSRIPHSEMAERFAIMVQEKRTWLKSFGHHAPTRNRRPEHEIDRKLADLAALEQAAEHFRRID